jgi:hypothetical protein
MFAASSTYKSLYTRLSSPPPNTTILLPAYTLAVCRDRAHGVGPLVNPYSHAMVSKSRTYKSFR